MTLTPGLWMVALKQRGARAARKRILFTARDASSEIDSSAGSLSHFKALERPAESLIPGAAGPCGESERPHGGPGDAAHFAHGLKILRLAAAARALYSREGSCEIR